MSFFDWLQRRKRGGKKPAAVVGGVHIDAAFDEAEEEAFLFGEWVDCRSSWVDAARWDADSSVLQLRIDGKEFDFPNVDETGAHVFATFNSKGRWFHSVYKGDYKGEAEAFRLP